MMRMSDLNLRRKKERKAEIHNLRIRDSYTHPHSTDIFLSKQVYARVYTVKEAIISIYGNFVPRTVKIGQGASRGRGSSVQINIGDLLIAGKQNVSVFKFLLLLFLCFILRLFLGSLKIICSGSILFT